MGGGSSTLPANCLSDGGAPIPCSTSVGAGGTGGTASENPEVTTDAPCLYDGTYYAVNAAFFASDNCNICSCKTFGRVDCTTEACTAVPTVGTVATKCGYSDAEIHLAGTTFPDTDGCNTCTCTSDGTILCTTNTCGSGTPGPTCSFDGLYVYGFTGGLSVFTDLVTLGTPATYQLVRSTIPNTANVNDDGSCAPLLPSCADSSLIDVSDIMNDILDPAVQLLLSLTTAQSIILGEDLRPMDGQMFSFKKGNAPGFLVGDSCFAGDANCINIPAPVSKLMNDLISLDHQQRKDPNCAGPLSSGL